MSLLHLPCCSYRPILIGIALPLSLFSAAHSAVIYEADFTVNPTPDMTLNAGGSPATYGTSGPGGSRALQVIDNATGGNVIAQIAMSTAGIPTFSTANAGQETIIFRADMAITSMTASANDAAIPRLIFRQTTTLTQSMTIGLGLNSSNNLVLFAARGNNALPNATDRVDLANFGTYSATAADNDTNDAYISIEMIYTNGASFATVTARQGSTVLGSGNVNGFSTTFSNSNLLILAATGTATTGELYVDNMRVEVIPEPSAGLVAGLAPLALRRKRAR